MNNNSISIIIVNYNTSENIIKLYESFRKYYSDDENICIIIVDNNSTLFEKNKLKKIEKSVKIIFNPENLGFGSACNLGAKYSDSEFILFLNPDTIFNNEILSEFIELYKKDSNLGVATCKLTDQNNITNYSFNDFHNLNYEIFEAFGRGTNNLINEKNKIIENSNDIFEIDWAVGAFMFMRKKVFLEVGGFDENFFLYYEDTDLCNKIKSLGYKNILIPFLSITHTQMSSIRSIKSENIFYFHLNRSNLIYVYKYFNYFEIMVIRITHIFGYIIRLFSLPFKKKFKNKRIEKLNQYFFILKIYLSTLNSVIKNKTLSNKLSEKSVNYQDEFWKKR